MPRQVPDPLPDGPTGKPDPASISIEDGQKWLRRQFRLYWRSLRPRESMMMLGVPMLGILFSSPPFTITTVLDIVFFFFGSFCIAGHVYTLNDLCGLTYDIYDQHKLERPLHARQLQAREVFLFSLIMLFIGLTIYYFLDETVLLIALLITLLWLVYALPATLFKGIPILTSLLNGIGSGIMPFLLGYALFSPAIDFKGLLISCYFGIIAGAGQMNREIIDIEPDVQAGLTTTAVKFGRKKTYVASFTLFIMSTVLFICLGLSQLLPSPWLGLFPLVGSIVHGAYFCRYLTTDLDRAIVISYVKAYRAVYAFVGFGIFLLSLLI